MVKGLQVTSQHSPFNASINRILHKHSKLAKSHCNTAKVAGNVAGRSCCTRVILPAAFRGGHPWQPRLHAWTLMSSSAVQRQCTSSASKCHKASAAPCLSASTPASACERSADVCSRATTPVSAAVLELHGLSAVTGQHTRSGAAMLMVPLSLPLLLSGWLHFPNFVGFTQVSTPPPLPNWPATASGLHAAGGRACMPICPLSSHCGAS